MKLLAGLLALLLTVSLVGHEVMFRALVLKSAQCQYMQAKLDEQVAITTMLLFSATKPSSPSMQFNPYKPGHPRFAPKVRPSIKPLPSFTMASLSMGDPRQGEWEVLPTYPKNTKRLVPATKEDAMIVVALMFVSAALASLAMVQLVMLRNYHNTIKNQLVTIDSFRAQLNLLQERQRHERQRSH